MPVATKQAKLILNVTVRRMLDDSSDTSWLGEYSNRPETEYAIDRAHSLDCKSIETKRDDYTYTHDWEDEFCTYCDMSKADAVKTPCSEYDFGDECDCHGGRIGTREFRYFNGPVSNYEGESPEDIRKYIQQDYERMESLNRGLWCFIGIKAEAQVQTDRGVIQRLSSGGLWGVESDGGKDYLESVEKEELDTLRDELAAYGFSKRAIAKAFKDVEHKDE